MFEYLLKQGRPHGQSTVFEPPPPSTVEQTLPFGQSYTQGPIYVIFPLQTTTYMQSEHHTIFNLEEQYGPSTSSRKEKEIVTPAKDDGTNAKLAKLATEIDLMKGGRFSISMDFEDLYIHPRDVLPPNIQMPNVEKYDGTTYHRMHLCMYCNVMFQWGHDEPILVQMFGQSLEKNARKWIANQEKNNINMWRALTRSFLNPTNSILRCCLPRKR